MVPLGGPARSKQAATPTEVEAGRWQGPASDTRGRRSAGKKKKGGGISLVSSKDQLQHSKSTPLGGQQKAGHQQWPAKVLKGWTVAKAVNKCSSQAEADSTRLAFCKG